MSETQEALSEVEGPERLAEEKRRRSEWRWLRRATVGGALFGALILGITAYTTWTPEDNTGLFALSRGDETFVGAILGAVVGVVAGFVLWALWVLSRTLVNRLSR
jgi:hypothetical protein